ncbi:MAG TPA: TIGR01777 family oxidoreductase [Syntrophorhabdales bacterium]|nr:TIGR01777 family oxidoreductase [Syntrophorhabdales bacterium]
MKILMTGGTGFIGPYLTDHLTRHHNEVTILLRSTEEAHRIPTGASLLRGDPTERGPWQEAIRDYDAVINLAGASIFSRWTDEQKKAIRESRVSTTRHIVEGMADRGKGMALFSASAVGYYGFHGDEELTEDSPPGDDFLAGIAVEWEREAMKARGMGARVVITRFGIVLGPGGGALGQMIPLFRMFVGGPIGSGRQWFSWVHIHDLAEAFVFLFNHREITGPVNLCSPLPVRNKVLAKSLGKALHRPSFFPAPAFMVKLVLGEFGSVILKGQRVLPRRLLDSGFIFEYPRIDEALEGIVGGS